MRPFAMPAACRLRIGIWTSLAVSMLLLPWAAEPVASAQGVDLHAAATTAFSERFSADLYGGYLKGQSREIAYNPSTGQKISELHSSIDEAHGVGLSLALRPSERWKISVGGHRWFKLDWTAYGGAFIYSGGQHP